MSKIKTKLDSAEIILDMIKEKSGAIYEQKSVEWYEMRTYTIGGSEIGNLVHQGKYNGFHKILLDRFAPEVFDEVGKFNCNFGNFFEEVTRMVFEKSHNTTVLETGSIEGFCYPQRFSPDGLAIVGNRTPVLCEFKTPVTRKYVEGYINDQYYEQVYTGLLTLYSKYKIRAKGMFMDSFMKSCYLNQLGYDNNFCKTPQCVFTGNNEVSFLGKKPMHIGVVIVIPKNVDEFTSFLLNSEGYCGGSNKKNFVNSNYDDCICEGKCGCTAKTPSPEKKFTGVIDLLQHTQLCDLLAYIYKVKDDRDKITLKLMTEKDKSVIKMLKDELESMQEITLKYPKLDTFLERRPPGFYVGYKVFKTNNVTIEIDKTTLVNDILYRTGCVEHMKKLMDQFNEYITKCKDEGFVPIFDRKKMSDWLLKAACRNKESTYVETNVLKSCIQNTIRKLPCDMLEECLKLENFKDGLIAKDITEIRAMFKNKDCKALLDAAVKKTNDCRLVDVDELKSALENKEFNELRKL